jgi:putative endonuclease
MPRKSYCVYIMASSSGTLYVGSSDNLIQRVRQHKDGTFDGFTKKYQVDRLVYFEVLTDGRAAARRERQVKKYGRVKKVALIEADNPSGRI